MLLLFLDEIFQFHLQTEAGCLGSQDLLGRIWFQAVHAPRLFTDQRKEAHRRPAAMPLAAQTRVASREPGDGARAQLALGSHHQGRGWPGFQSRLARLPKPCPSTPSVNLVVHIRTIHRCREGVHSPAVGRPRSSQQGCHLCWTQLEGRFCRREPQGQEQGQERDQERGQERGQEKGQLQKAPWQGRRICPACCPPPPPATRAQENPEGKRPAPTGQHPGLGGKLAGHRHPCPACSSVAVHQRVPLSDNRAFFTPAVNLKDNRQ